MGRAPVGACRVCGVRSWRGLRVSASTTTPTRTRPSRSASVDVLDALATALQLNDAERQHLHLLAKPQPIRRNRRSKPQSVNMATLRLLELLDEVWSPAFVLGRRLDVLAHNRLAGALITEFRELPAPQRNQARFVFLDPHARELYADWNEVAADTVAMLRLDAGRYPDDEKLSALVRELSVRSTEFGPGGLSTTSNAGPRGPRPITIHSWAISPLNTRR